jgi:hypothetical protein
MQEIRELCLREALHREVALRLPGHLVRLGGPIASFLDASSAFFLVGCFPMRSFQKCNTSPSLGNPEGGCVHYCMCEDT